MEVDAGALFSTGFDQEAGTLLDRLTCLAAVFIRIKRDEWTDEILHRFLSIYEIPMSPGPTTQVRQAAQQWLAIAERLEALGALAVRRHQWQTVRRIAVLRTPGRQPHWPYVLRHAVVESGRVGLLEPQDRKAVSLVSLARTDADRLNCLRPDLANTDGRILDSICQFDFLAALSGVSEYGEVESKVFYTNFATYYTERVEPIVERLLVDPELRGSIFPGPDRELAAALAALNGLAMSEGFRFGGWDGFTNPTIVRFVQSRTS
jgi:hypothetical protein